jgi:Tol biopolymer transport system component
LQIFIMNADGNLRLFPNREGRATEPRWSPDGKSFYFTDCKKVDCGIFFGRAGGKARHASI